jgi:hypothetical protein
MSEKPYVGDIGTVVIVNCGSSIVGASTKQLKVKKPDGTEVTWEAEIYESNYLRYVIVDGDFDQEGVYYLQGKVVLTGWSGSGETVDFRVYDPYD